MHVLWRRPDGFHGASPEDFVVLDLGGHSRIWLHKTDRQMFPFKVSGGWQDEDATKRLNGMVNILNRPTKLWVEHLCRVYHHSMGDDPARFLEEKVRWLADLKGSLKGDTWETEIMAHALDEIVRHVGVASADFIQAVKAGS